MELDIKPMGKLPEKTGQSFGKWIVLGRGPEKDSRHPRLWCQCSCEERTIKLVDVGALRRGTSTSCGCERKRIAKETMNKRNSTKSNLVGNIYGDFRVIKKLDEKQSGYYVWETECIHCGLIRKINTQHLKNNANVCNCQISKGSAFERLVADIFIKNKIYFLREKTFDDFKYEDTGKKPRYDFYLPKYNCLIELDGEQHYKEFSLSKYSLKEVQEKDKIKTDWAIAKGFNFIRIPYYDKDKITLKDLLPETSPYKQ